MLKLSLLKLASFLIALGAGGASVKKKPVPVPEHHPAMVRASARADEILEVVESMVANPEQREAWTRSLFGWGFWEASWYVNPPGSNDDGKACGVFQIHSPERIVEGATCEMLRKDGKLAAKVALTLLLEREKACGSKAAAWTAFSWDGACHAQTLTIVKYRCLRLGLTDRCEAKPADTAK